MWASKKYDPFIIALLLMWALAVALIGVVGEFPINDDWAYSKNVYELTVNQRFVVDEWPAMTLVSQTFYGYIFTSVAGFSFTVLRISVLLLGIIASLVLYRMLYRLSGNNRLTAFVATAGFCFSTLFCALSFTFMTDIFFLSFLIFALDSLFRFLEKKRSRYYILFCLYCLVAVLNRQHGLLLPLVIVLPLLWKQKITLRNVTLAFLPMLLCLIAHKGYSFLLSVYHIPHNMNNLGHFKKSVTEMELSTLQIHAGDMLLVTGWLLLPLVLLLFTNHYRFKRAHAVWLLLSLVLAWLLVYKDWIYYPQGNISRYMEVGPRVVQEGERMGLQHESWLKTVVKLISFLSFAGIIYWLLTEAIKRLNALRIGLFLFMAAYFVFVAFNQAYFDRYTLPFALLLLLLIVPLGAGRSRKAAWIVLPVVIYLYAVSVIQVKDHMNWQRTRWTAISRLHALNIGPQQIDGGFEYNGWYKPGKGFEEGKSWWWVHNDAYVISSAKINGYKTAMVVVYQRYIPFETDTIYVLEKITE